MINKFSPTYQGIFYVLLAMACFAGMSGMVRLASMEMSTVQLVFLRNVLSLVLVVLWVIPKGFSRLESQRKQQHFWRAMIGVISMNLWFYALSHMPLNVATALSFTTPIFISIIAIVFLKEHGSIARWIAIAAGFCGVMVIMRPGAEAFSVIAVVVLASSALIAIISIWVKLMVKTESNAAVIFYMALFMTPLSFPLALTDWNPVTLDGLWFALGVAVTSTLAHIFLFQAYKNAEMISLMPLDFTRLVFTAVLAYMWFGETLDSWTVLGGSIIVLASIYSVSKEHDASLLARAKTHPSNDET